MRWERMIFLEGKNYKVTISNEQKALRSAYAEGRAIIGLWNREEEGQSLEPAEYVVEAVEDIDEQLLERVVRRRMGFPWIIAETKHLLIREFVPEDAVKVPKEERAGDNDEIFWDEEKLRVYSRSQYRFYEYGIWAVIEKKSGLLIGKAGLTDLPREVIGLKGQIKKEDIPLELGYHIFLPYRRCGYGKEACQAILTYGSENISDHIYARIHKNNKASLNLAESLGFRIILQEYSELAPDWYLNEWYCS